MTTKASVSKPGVKIPKEKPDDKPEIDVTNLLMELYNNLSGQIFFLNDSDDTFHGYIITSCPEDTLSKLWSKFYYHTNADGTTDDGDEQTFGDLEIKPDGTNWIGSYSVPMFAQFLRKLGYAAIDFDMPEIHI